MRKLAKQGKTGMSDQDADGIGDADVERTPMSLPKAHTGRPDVEDVLASLCEQHSDEGSIGVIAAGRKAIALRLLLTSLSEQRSAEGSVEVIAADARAAGMCKPRCLGLHAHILNCCLEALQ